MINKNKLCKNELSAVLIGKQDNLNDKYNRSDTYRSTGAFAHKENFCNGIDQCLFAAYRKIWQRIKLLYYPNAPERALADAAESDKHYANGTARALEGIPLGMKDLFATRGIRQPLKNVGKLCS